MIKLSLYLGLGLLLCCNAAEFSGRIIEGRESQPEDAVSVTIYSIPNTGESDAFLTTGVAISPRLVLGTGQAVKTIIKDTFVEFEAHKIGFDSIAVDEQTIALVDRIVVHEKYNFFTLEFNIAAFHLAEDLISIFVPFDFVGNIPIPDTIKLLGYGAPNAESEFSSVLLTTIGGVSNDCSPVLNSLVYGETNHCIRTEFPLAQGDQGGPITNSWLTPDHMSLFCLVSFWTRSDPTLVIVTNLKHPQLEDFIRQQIQ